MSTLYTYTPYPSRKMGKKYDVYVPDPSSGRMKVVSFGAVGYSDFTMHKDESRKAAYWRRHHKDHLEDPRYAGFWSAHFLWNKTTKEASLKDLRTRFHLVPSPFRRK